MSQLPDVRVSSPVQPKLPHVSAAGYFLNTEQEQLRNAPANLSCDDYDADFELAWLGYILAKSQDRHGLNRPTG